MLNYEGAFRLKSAALKTQIRRMFAITVSAVAIFSAFASLAPQSVSAASATFYLSPATASIDNGSSVQLNIMINAGANHLTAVQACITYDSSKLTFTNINLTGLLGILRPCNLHYFRA